MRGSTVTPPAGSTETLLTDLAADMRVLKASLAHIDKKLDRAVYRDVDELEKGALVRRLDALEKAADEAAEDRNEARTQRNRLVAGFAVSAILAVAPYVDDLLRLVITPPT